VLSGKKSKAFFKQSLGDFQKSLDFFQQGLTFFHRYLGQNKGELPAFRQLPFILSQRYNIFRRNANPH
jgi:hypothetical protein